MVASEQHLFKKKKKIVQFDKTIVLPRKLATGSIHDYFFCYCPLVGILFEELRMIRLVVLQLSVVKVSVDWSGKPLVLHVNNGQ